MSFCRECGGSNEASKEKLIEVVSDLAILIRRLVVINPDTSVAIRAIDYLQRNELLGSPLRKEDIDV